MIRIDVKRAALLLIVLVICLITIQTEKRTVYVKLAIDKSFKALPEWEQLIEYVTKGAFKQFDCQLGIKFKVKKTEEVELPRSPLYDWIIDEKMRWLTENVDPDDCDIVIYFLGREDPDHFGCVDDVLVGRFVLTTYSEEHEGGIEAVIHNVIHEIGHLFGADHFCNDDSVMYAGALDKFKFDKRNEHIVLRNKWRNF